MEAPLLGLKLQQQEKKKTHSFNTTRALCFFSLTFISITFLGLVLGDQINVWLLGSKDEHSTRIGIEPNNPQVVESEQGVVASEDSRCSEIGASMLRRGGHAVDAAVATALCLGVVNAVATGIGGGSFMLVRSSSDSVTKAIDMRETAPSAATQDMYADKPESKHSGPMSMGYPVRSPAFTRHGHYGRLPWKSLFRPAIELARGGFLVAPYLGLCIATFGEKLILRDPGLSRVYAPAGKLLRTGEICYNVELGRSLEEVAEGGPRAFYNGTVGERLVRDVRESGGILTMEDLRNYKVEVTEAMAVDAMGYTILGMPPPSSGTLALSLVLNIFASYNTPDAAKGSLGLHRLIEALKHMLAIRMSLGDPDYTNIQECISEMLSPSFAKQIQEKILDNTTFPPEYYQNRWSQLNDHGTSHISIVDADRNAVSMTSTVNYAFGGGVLSPSTGIVLNNEMDDFSTPTDSTPDFLPPAPSNFIRPHKRPLSSMTPLIITKDDQLVGVIGGGGGLNIIPAVIQVFLNHFVLGLEPLTAVLQPRIYHRLIPNVVSYENWTLIDGEHIELAEEKKLFLRERNHELESKAGGAIVQLVVQTLRNPIDLGRKNGKDRNVSRVIHGTLTAVSDPRKDGKPAAM